MSGYYCMKRGWQDHEFFAEDEFSRRDAWEWLIAEAKWKETKKRIGGKTLILKRGQLSHSIRFMAEKWRWHRSKAERFINALKIETMIETVTETGQVIITICNYDEYQSELTNSETVAETLGETAARQQRDKVEERKKEIKETDDDDARAREANPKINSDEIKNIFEKLETFFNSPHPYIMAPIAAWLEWGADYELDILPVAKRHLAMKKTAPRSLTWLNDDIARSIDQRTKGKPDIATTGPPAWNQPARQETLEEILARKRKKYGITEEATP